MKTLNQNGRRLQAAVAGARKRTIDDDDSGKFHVVGAGRTITSAYEQLRNATEYTEDHLLLQRAIRRFYKRLFLSPNSDDTKASGEELVTELTLAGYLANDSVSSATIKEISELAVNYRYAYDQIDQSLGSRVDDWTIDVLAVEVEAKLSSPWLRDVFVQFAFKTFLDAFDPIGILNGSESEDYELALYAAVYRSLLKSDEATIRWAILMRFQQSPLKTDMFVVTNQKIDEVLGSRLFDRLTKAVSRHGAAMRVLWRFIHDSEEAEQLMQSPGKFLPGFEAKIISEYEAVNGRINRGIVKSVVFLIITKFLIGVAIEVPYDYWQHGEILWIPLIVNLFLPPIYMVLLRLTLSLPKPANTVVLVDQIENLLYKNEKLPAVKLKASRQYGTAFNVAYGLAFILIFGLASLALVSIGFSLVHLLIFFVFFSTASFLGFRLSRMIRELEAVKSDQSGVAMVRDFIYLPFVVVGQKLSESYSRFNVMAVILDMVIELPLKTVLRLLRQWGGFISDKKDDL